MYSFTNFVDHLREMREDRILEISSKYSHIPEAYLIDTTHDDLKLSQIDVRNYEVLDVLDNYVGDIKQSSGKWKIRVAEHRGWIVSPRKISQTFKSPEEAFTYFPNHIQHLY